MQNTNSTRFSATAAGARHGRPWPLLSLAVLALSLAATWGAWDDARKELQRSKRTEFDFQARQAIRRIEQRMATYEQVERGTEAFLLGSVDVGRENFRLYVQSLRLEEKFPGIQGIALARIVPAAGMQAHVAAVRREIPSYAVSPAGERDVYSSITHIEPLRGMNLRALGFDMLSEPTRRAAMERARDTGEAAASGKVRLVQEDGNGAQAGLVMYLPVYRRGMPARTLEQRRAHIIGWVGAPFRMDDLMAGLGGERSGDIMLSIYDGERVDEAARLYGSSPEAGGPDAARATLRSLHRLVIGGRPWTLDLRATPAFEARQDTDKPNIILLVGAAASVLLALLVWTLASGRRLAVAHARSVTRQLGDSEFRWKYALEGAGDGVWDWDRGSGETVFSRRWKEMLGYEEGELEAGPATWASLIHPDDAAMVDATLQAYLDSGDASYEAEYRMRCKDGGWRWILARGMAVTRGADGKPQRTIGTHTDITRSREDAGTLRDANTRLAAERHRVQVILERSHDAFVAIAPDGTVTDWNAKAEEMLGFSASEAIGRDLSELIIPPEMRAAHKAGLSRFVQSGQGTFIRSVVEVNALHRSGRLVPVELAIAGFPAAGGYAASAFIRDISQRKQAERLEGERSRALEEARTALQHAQKLEAVGKLTGGIAHDFNNVLHVIGGNVQLLQAFIKDDERLQARLRSMQDAVDRGAKLSSQLLAFARRQPLRPASLNLMRTIGNMEDLLQRALGESVAVSLSAQEGLWNTLADPGQVENVVLNLAINARDAMPHGGTLAIALRNCTLGGADAGLPADVPAGDYVHLAMSDSGTGMSEEVRSLAFEPFFTTKPVGQGTGLGLSMAYGFVKQSGGHIQLDSAPGAGATVGIYLPRSHETETPAAAPQAEAVSGGRETILVVEDDAEVRLTAVSTLGELGYRVLDAHDGESALALLRGGEPVDLLFTDVVMPGPVSSTELAALAKELLPAMAVLYTSGYTRNALVTGGRLDPGVQLLGKPYRRAELDQKVRELLARRAAPGK